MTSPDPTRLVAAATGFMAAKQLFTASDTGLFAALRDGPLTEDDLARHTGLPARSARILADAMVGLGLLEHRLGGYHNSPVADAYLAGRSGLDLRPYLRFWDNLSYPHWRSYGESIRTATPAAGLMADNMDVFMAGVQAYNSLHAVMLAERYDWTRHRRVLDLAGLSPDFLARAARRNPELHGTFATTEPMLGMARSSVDPEMRSRIDFHEADPLTDEIPGTYDAVLLEHVIHRYDAEQNRTILRTARRTVESGGRLLLLDFLLDPADARTLDPLLAGEYLVVDGTVVYPEDEVRDWLANTGWQPVEMLPLPGSPRVLIAAAT